MSASRYSRHVNHMLRGDESDRDEAAARSFCQMYGIPLEVRRIDVERIAKEENAGVEETGRKVRYAFFEEIRRLHGAALIATALRCRIRRRLCCSASRGEAG